MGKKPKGVSGAAGDNKPEVTTTTPKAENDKVHILSVAAKNIKCIRQAEISTEGEITEIRGDTGAGKTSWLRAIEAGINGIAPDLITKGQDNAQVILKMDRATIERAIKPGTEDLKVFDVNGIRMTSKRAKDFLKMISAPEVFNAIEWVMLADGPNAGKTERLRKQRDMLLAAIPLRMEPKDLSFPPELKKALKEVDFTGIDTYGDHALIVVQQMGKAVYQHRKGYNVMLEDAKRTLESALEPETEPPGFPLAACQEQAQLAEKAYNEIMEQVRENDHTEERIEEIKAQMADFPDDTPAKDEIDAWFRNLDKSREESENKVEDLHRQIADEQARMGQLSDSAREMMEHKGQRNQIEGLERSITSLEGALVLGLTEKAEAKEREMISTAKGLEARKIIDDKEVAKQRVEKIEKTVEPLDQLVVAFRDALPKQLVSRMELPVEGMSIDDDSIRIDDIPLHQLGTSQMIPVGVKIAAMLNPECGFLTIDRAESLGSKDRKILADSAKELGLNLILTIVDPDAVAGEGVIVMEDGEVLE